jgi:hypoxanthine phosphoribosyltransferase
MTLIGQTPLEGAERFPSAQEACPCKWVQVSWDELALLCRRLARQLQGEEQPEVVVALARAGYVPGAILASLLRCDLLTLGVPPARSRGLAETEQAAAAPLRERLSGRRVLVIDETTRTGESLAWATRVALIAGASAVRTAVLHRPPQGPEPDHWAAVSRAHLLQPWISDCA